MADSAVAVTAGAGTSIDTRTEATNGNHRQVVVLGDPATNAGVAPVDATNGLSVSITNASLTVASHAVTNAGTFATQAVTTGNVAHDAVDSGAPQKVGGRARSSEIAPVANDDRTDFITDLAGKQIILPYANPENFVSGTTTAMTGTTSTSLIAAPAAGLRNYITTIIVSNAHATVGTDVVIQDGSS